MPAVLRIPQRLDHRMQSVDEAFASRDWRSGGYNKRLSRCIPIQGQSAVHVIEKKMRNVWQPLSPMF